MTKKQLRALSPSETEILRLVWESDGSTVQDVCDLLPQTRKIAYATVQTLLRRIEKKGYIEHKLHGKAHVFYPVAKKEEVIKRTVSDFLDRLFGGDAVPLIQYLAEHGRLDARDIEKLKELIDKK